MTLLKCHYNSVPARSPYQESEKQRLTVGNNKVSLRSIGAKGGARVRYRRKGKVAREPVIDIMKDRIALPFPLNTRVSDYQHEATMLRKGLGSAFQTQAPVSAGEIERELDI